MLKLKQYLCRHEFEIIAIHDLTAEPLKECKKCGVFHIGRGYFGFGYNCKEINVSGWVLCIDKEDK